MADDLTKKILGIFGIAAVAATILAHYYPPKTQTNETIQRTKLYSPEEGYQQVITTNFKEGFANPREIMVEIRKPKQEEKYEAVLNYQGNRYLMRTNDSGDIYLEKCVLEKKL